MLGIWALMIVVITNAYKGILVSNLTSPLPLRTEWNMFKYMEGFHFYMPQNVAYLVFSWVLNGTSVRTNWLIGNIVTECLKSPSNISLMCLISMSDLNESQVRAFERTGVTAILLVGNSTRFGLNSAVLSVPEVSSEAYVKHTSGKRKQAVLLERHKMLIFMKYTKAKKLPYVIGQDQIFTENKALYVEELFAGATLYRILLNRLKLLMSSGIYQFCNKWYAIKLFPQWTEKSLFQLLRNEGEDTTTTVHPISMTTNVFLAFYIYIFGCLFSVAILVLEKLFYCSATILSIKSINSLYQKLHLVICKYFEYLRDTIWKYKMACRNKSSSLQRQKLELAD